MRILVIREWIQYLRPATGTTVSTPSVCATPPPDDAFHCTGQRRSRQGHLPASPPTDPRIVRLLRRPTAASTPMREASSPMKSEFVRPLFAAAFGILVVSSLPTARAQGPGQAPA